MSQFSTLREIEGEPDYNHLDGDRSIKLTASIADGRPRGRPSKVEPEIKTLMRINLSTKSLKMLQKLEGDHHLLRQ